MTGIFRFLWWQVDVKIRGTYASWLWTAWKILEPFVAMCASEKLGWVVKCWKAGFIYDCFLADGLLVQIHEIHHKVRPESVELLRRDYTANGGWETFLSYEDPERDILVGLLRLRKCSEEGTFRPELVRKEGDEGGCSIVRELHVYGTAVPVHGRDPTKFQHQVRGSLGKIKIWITSTHCIVNLELGW